ncbi:hypothetical protein Golob_026595, partial [Gossypium lobatum]|nr:hypothetical protein [Gossypium lobatum]
MIDVLEALLRNQNGSWILGYNHYLRKYSAFEVDLLDILDSILILLSKGFNKATIQIDNLEVVKLCMMWESGLQVYEDAPNEVLKVLQKDQVN